MHLLKTDLEYGTIVSSGRKSVTLQAEGVNFKLRRVVRKPYERIIKEGLLSHSTPPLSPAEFKVLHDTKELWTENLASWPTQFPLVKFSVRRFSELYYLTAIDEQSTDSYFLKTRDWGQIERALADLTSGIVKLPTPLILELANPFACYAPFEPPSWDDFEMLNSNVRGVLEGAIEKLHAESPAGFLSPKLAATYSRLLAEVEALATLPQLIPPPKSDFERA